MSTEGNNLLISRGTVEPDSKRSYKGVLFRNTFKVDRPIVLLGVSFFGPHDKFKTVTPVPYQITIKLQTSWIHGPCKIVSRPTVRSRLVKKGDKVRINFLEMQILKPNIWYDIEFELNGPPTGHIKLEKLKTQYKVEDQGRDVLVMDCMVGSCQMSDFHFLLY